MNQNILKPKEKLQVPVGGRNWVVERSADLETLWESIGEDEFGEDERLPYWAELWPASVLLGEWLLEHAEMIRGRTCLDIGCGLGLTGVIAAACGARVCAFDYEWPAVWFARRNAGYNDVPQPLWLQMDWRDPAVQPGVFDCAWAGDVFYEKRFFEPLEKLLSHGLSPLGQCLVAAPVRTVSNPAWQWLRELGWSVDRLTQRKVPLLGQNATVELWRIRRAG